MGDTLVQKKAPIWVSRNKRTNCSIFTRPRAHLLKSEDAMGGWKKEGGWKTSRMTPLPKRGLDPPSYGTFSTPLGCQCSVFPVQKIHDRGDQKLFWGGVQKFSGERVLWYVFPPPIRFAPPHITARLNRSGDLIHRREIQPKKSTPQKKAHFQKVF